MARDPIKPRRRIPWLWLNVVACALWFFVPGIERAVSQSVTGDTCAKRLHRLGSAMEMYCADYDMRMPPSATWGDAVLSYAGSKTYFTCPDLDPSGQVAYGHAFQRELSLKDTRAFDDLGRVPVLFDSKTLSWNASGHVGNFSGGRQQVAYLDGSVSSGVPSQ